MLKSGKESRVTHLANLSAPERLAQTNQDGREIIRKLGLKVRIHGKVVQ